MSVQANIGHVRMQRYKMRRHINSLILTLTLLAMMFGVFWFFWILWDVFRLGFDGLSLTVFTEMTPPPMGQGGGLANAMIGSLLMVVGATVVATPAGILVGIYLCEYSNKNLFATVCVL